MSTKKQQAILQNWCKRDDRLVGEVWNHPGFDDGQLIRTSIILSPPDAIRMGGIVETKNTVYTLQEQSDKHDKELIYKELI